MRGGHVKRLTKQSLPNTRRAFLYRDCRVALRAPRNDMPRRAPRNDRNNAIYPLPFVKTIDKPGKTVYNN
ncbi:MAG: hypothetical protein LBL66_09250 [Clostridiales bacterium]|nr:hypothetical protein [Clostridiales bacterium]